jgi:hypothetical protein
MTIRRAGAPNGHPERSEGSRGTERASTRAGAPNGHPERSEGSRGAERASMRVRARVEARG